MKTNTPRTKVTLTIAGLLALTGIFYAASPTQFGSVPEPIGVAAAPSQLIVSEYCSQNLDTIDCLGNVSLLATIPGPVGPCGEKYMTIAPSQSALAGFTPRDVFVTQGTAVYKVLGASGTLFATITGCQEDHTGITFDHAGTFGYNMIVTCEGGGVWQVDSTGTPTHIAETNTAIEGPAVPPLSFGPLGGQILVADEYNGQVHAIANDGTVTLDVFDWYGAESVQVIPSAQCTHCGGGAFFQAIENFNAIYQYSPTDFTGLGGNILVPSEYGAGTALITWNGSNYSSTFFGNIPGATFEGSAFADCDVPPTTLGGTPSPTPTATAIASATPAATTTPAATATPTATATAASTATATPTPTPTISPTTVTAAPASGVYAGTVNLSATLTSSGSPLSGKTINFTLNGNPVGSAITNGSGVATKTSVSLSGIYPGFYPSGVGASFAGDSSYAPSSGTASLRVTYGTCTGSDPGGVILPPINAGGTSVFQHGSTVPVKFKVCDANGNSISDPNAVFASGSGSVTMITNLRGTVDNINEATYNDIPDSAFHFGSGSGVWIFNLVTSNLSRGSTYYFQINLRDGSAIQFQFGVK